MSSFSIPTSSALPAHQRVPANTQAVVKILSKLSRPSLISLVLDWLDDQNQFLCAPYMLLEDEEEDDSDLYPPARSLDELRDFYNALAGRRGARRDVVDRIVEGDWRHGISLYQLAMADVQYLYDHPKSQKWTALKVVQRKNESDSDDTPAPDDEIPCIPRFHPSTFLQNLERQVLPDVKVHYNLDRPPNLPLLLLRIYVLDSPYNTSLALQGHAEADPAAFDSSKTIYVAFPDASPFLYVSLATTTGVGGSMGDARSLRKMILDGIPKAFSRARERYGLEATNLSAKGLDALVARRGGGRTNAAAGGWEIYADKNKKDTPLNTQLPEEQLNLQDDKENQHGGLKSKTGLKRKSNEVEGLETRRRKIAQGRFGNTARLDDGKGIERLDIRLEDPYPMLQGPDVEFSDDEAEVNDVSERRAEDLAARREARRTTIATALERPEDDGEQGSGWRPDVKLTLNGSHVFAGIRKLVELGVIDGERMPGWLTGEEGVSVGVVRDGRIRGFKGSGL